MVRTRSGGFLAVLTLIALLMTACGASAPKTSWQELFREYTRSTHVKNDKIPGNGGTTADRLANLASMGTPDQLLAGLLVASPCEAYAGCRPGGAAGRAVRDFAGSGGSVFERSVLVKHHSGSLELVTLYVARRHDGTAALVDSDGRTYEGGLDDFRRHNELLGPDDVILTLRDITSVPGKGKVVAVSGHTTPDRGPWLIGSAGAVLVLGAALALRTVRRRGRATAGPGPARA
ncbi:hypothetical protein [Streptomyces sp. NBC_00005]|uniref:hypothetical protein n=1 Tax=Streptomyces sp. NBC_00005 TaxID=2903609 RepID=UPI003255E755